MNIKTTHHCKDQDIRIIKRGVTVHRCCECKQTIPRYAPSIVASGYSKNLGTYYIRWCIACNVLHTTAKEYSTKDNLLFFGHLHEFIANLP